MASSIAQEPDTLLTVEGTEQSGERKRAPGDAAAGRERPQRIADRYLVEDEIGRGGLAVVYRVIDSVSNRRIALKQLAIATTHRLFREQSAAFEREFHTLMQLSHPRIIEVYDFGVDERGRYYTMELLEGSDLKERSPLPWREACALIYDVCSSLALLHSRGFVHRDVTPRNVRRAPDGSAKLIDFGTLVPMGPCAQVVGTPAFVAPEVVHRSALDGRTDLFSLGATLYFVLTGRLAYAGRHFSNLHEAWSVRPASPSAIVSDIPSELSALVSALISLDPAARPSSAFEVMQRLATIADFEHTEDAAVSQAYLAAPVLVGRDAPVAALRARIDRARAGHGGGVLIRGVAGVGRSRMLDAFALDAKIAGAAVLRVDVGRQGDEPLAVARSLAEQIVETMPELAAKSAELEGVSDVLFDAAPSDGGTGSNAPPPAIKSLAVPSGVAASQSALARWLLRIAREQPLSMLVDDVHRADQASLALLATLTRSAPRLRLLLLVTAERGVPACEAEAFSVLERECAHLEIGPLDPKQTEALATALFGDVPNVPLVSHRLYEVALGNPRETMDLVQWLIARKAIRYEGGRWVLPERLDAADLPSSAAESCRQTVAALSPLARLLGQVHALASHPALGRSDYGLAASEVSAQRLDQAITELLSERVLSGDGRGYLLSRREWRDALLEGLDDATRRQRHALLAQVYAGDEALALERADHLLSAGDDAAGLDIVLGQLARAAGNSQGVLALTKLRPQQVASILDRALTSAERLGRKPSELHALRHALVAISIPTDETYYLRAAPAFFAQLEHDSGLGIYASIGDAATPSDRLMRALKGAAERYAATAEDDRVLSPELAIRGLAYYVVVSIAMGSRMQDAALLRSLPAVLEPFAPLSPVLRAIWQNSIATRESNTDNQPELARTRWLEVLDILSQVSVAEVSYVENLRRAIIYGIGLVEARLGLLVTEQRARMLDDDPLQAVSAMSLRKTARLHQGDFAGAERYRKAGEQLALHANVRSMFSSTLQAELIAHALASDLTGIQRMAEKIEPLAERFAGWRPFKHLAEGYFEQTRGRPEAALAAFERGLALSMPGGRVTGGAWPRLEAACIEVLVQLDRAAEARVRGERALETCAAQGIDAAAFPIRRARALAEAKLGDYAGASAMLEGVIADMVKLGTTGLELGATYEARARIAIWFSDDEAIVAFARHTAKEYRYGEGSSLGARYERLMDEARGEGVSALPELLEFQTKMTTSHLRGASAASLVVHKLAGAATAQERAERVLRLLSEAHAGRSCQLYVHTERGFERVASLGEGMADRALDEFVRSYAASQQEESEFATAVDSGAAPQLTSSCWVDGRGASHHPLLLMADVEGAARCVGAVVIEVGEAAGFMPAGRHLLDAVGDYLFRSGDARAAAPVEP